MIRDLGCSNCEALNIIVNNEGSLFALVGQINANAVYVRAVVRQTPEGLNVVSREA